MARLAIKNGVFLLGDNFQNEGVLFCEGDKIKGFGKERDITPSDLVIDAQGAYVSPGFVDIHVHGGGGHDFMDGTEEAFRGVAAAHAEYGTTSLCPTTLTCTDEELFQSFEIYRKLKSEGTGGAKFAGLHLEGPYFSPSQAGAQDPSFLKKPIPEHYERIFAASDDIIRWSVAPELDGSIEFGNVLRKRGIVGSIAHTDCIYERAVEAFENGYTHATHLYSCMSTVHRKNAYRYAGALEAAYMMDDMTVEIIADGVHIPKPLLQFAYKFKGSNKIALCTDAMRGAGMPDGESILGSLKNGQRVLIEDGVAKMPDRKAFAGSVATTIRLVETMVTLAEVSLTEAIKMMTSTPARIIGADKRIGSLDPGKDADITIFNKGFKVIHTIVNGKIVK